MHTGDWHYGLRATNVTRQGFNQRELDIYDAGEVLVDYLLAEIKPDIVCIVGDVYQATRPDALTNTKLFSTIKRLKDANIEVVVIGGNHDTPARPGRESPLSHLEKFFGVHLFLEQGSKEVGGIVFHALPYRALSGGEVKEFEYSQELPNILLGHATVDSPLMPPFAAHDLVKISEAQCDREELAVTMLGHIHIHKRVTEKAYYCGGIERLSFGEMKLDPAIWVHEVQTDNSVNSQSVRLVDMGGAGVPRPVADLKIDGEDKSIEEIDEEAKSLLSKNFKEYMLRLTVTGAPRALRGSGVVNEWRNIAYKDQKCFYLEVRLQSQELEKLMDEVWGQDSETTLNLEGEWKQFLEKKKRQDLLSPGLKLIREASG